MAELPKMRESEMKKMQCLIADKKCCGRECVGWREIVQIDSNYNESGDGRGNCIHVLNMHGCR